MFAGRAAILILALSLSLLSFPASASCVRPSGRGSLSTSCAVDPPTAGPIILPLLDPTSLAQFNPWIARLKVVLEDTDHKFGEDADLGPARPPRKHMSRASVDLANSRHPTMPPLRC